MGSKTSYRSKRRGPWNLGERKQKYRCLEEARRECFVIKRKGERKRRGERGKEGEQEGVIEEERAHTHTKTSLDHWSPLRPSPNLPVSEAPSKSSSPRSILFPFPCCFRIETQLRNCVKKLSLASSYVSLQPPPLPTISTKHSNHTSQ